MVNASFRIVLRVKSIQKSVNHLKFGRANGLVPKLEYSLFLIKKQVLKVILILTGFVLNND